MGTRGGRRDSTDYSVNKDGFCSRARDFMSNPYMVAMTTVVMAILITSATLILVLITIPQMVQIRSSLANQTATLQAQVHIRSDVVSRLWGQLLTLEEHVKNRSALVSRLEDNVWAFPEQLKACSLLESRLEGQVYTLEEHLNNRSALTKRLEDQVSTLEERLVNRSALISRLKGQVSTLEEQLDQKSAMCKATPKQGKIFILRSPKGVYMYDLDEARQACAETGAVLASSAQLHRAWQDGYERCACGWLTDGTARYPMQKAWPGCGSRKGVIHCEWQGTWDAWCFRFLPFSPRDD